MKKKKAFIWNTKLRIMFYPPVFQNQYTNTIMQKEEETACLIILNLICH